MEREEALSRIKNDDWDIGQFRYIIDNFNDDKDIMKEIIDRNLDFWNYTSEELRKNKEVVLKAVENGLSLKDVSEEFRGDKEVVLAAVKYDLEVTAGNEFEFASEELKRDKEFVLELVRIWAFVLEFASEELRGDKEIVLAAVKSCGYALEYASEELRGNKEVVLEALKNYYIDTIDVFEAASEELRGDKEVVLEAVKYGLSLGDVSEEFQGDKEVVLEAVKRNGKDLEYASEGLKGDIEVALEAIKGYNGEFNDFKNSDFSKDILQYIDKRNWDNKTEQEFEDIKKYIINTRFIKKEQSRTKLEIKEIISDRTIEDINEVTNEIREAQQTKVKVKPRRINQQDTKER